MSIYLCNATLCINDNEWVIITRSNIDESDKEVEEENQFLNYYKLYIVKHLYK